ncbi:protein ETHYLENE-INSENSITIVE 2-like isoform X2 [Phoenix dactylifera]|uniref:Protein ETHYLENE-INSENSITIVE 2-like isoform X2 n=1 Tax=Phoenix dactylifera TaxID=42345 RepID=A0A8B7C4I2_PHODC|nr:protein ETHYLENE-INSENSITIVE 2-like isoform X2 [Phoenix dactylifera]
MEYMDLGKWVAAIEGGAHIGLHLILVLFFFNCSGILCQYLANLIGIVTGKNLAQICNEEYCRLTCVLLGVQAQISMIVSDLTMILSFAHGFSLFFGVNQFISIYFSATIAVLIPYIFNLLGSCKLEAVYGISSFVSLFGVLSSLPNIPSIAHDRYPGLDLQTACSVMVLLGSNIMPHNFYIHSSVVQLQKPTNASVGSLIHDTLFTIISNFAAIFLVNFVFMSSTAAVFDNAGLIMPTFQDAFMLVDQIFNSPAAPFPFSLVFLIAIVITSCIRSLGAQVILHDFFQINLPIWVHHIIVKSLAVIPALYCLQSVGPEGIYQLLLFCQVILATLVPPSVIPLFRVSSSRSIMGFFRISQHTDIFAFCAFLVFLATDTIFIFELLFENCFWTVELRESMGRGVRLVLLLLAITSYVFALYMVFTPLRSESNRLDDENSKGPDMQIFTWGRKKDQLELSKGRDENSSSQTINGEEKEYVKETTSIESLENQSNNMFAEFSLDQPKTAIHSEWQAQKPASVLALNKDCIIQSLSLEEYNSIVNIVSSDEVISKGIAQNYETKVSREENVEVGVGVHHQKDGEKGGACEPVQPPSASTSDVPGSCKNARVTGGNIRNDAKKATSCGLSRAGRRQLAAILNEFWAHLFDLHGLLTEEAKVMRTDLLLNLDLEMYHASARAGTKDTSQKSSLDTESGPLPSANSRDYTPMQEKAMNLELSYMPLAQTSFWSMDTRFLDVNGQCDGQDCHIPKIQDFEIPQFGTWLRTPNIAKSSVTEYGDQLQDTSSQNASGSLCKSSLQNPASTGSICSQFRRPQYEPSSVENPSFLGSTKENISFPDISELIDSFGRSSLNISGSFSSASGTAHEQAQNPNNLVSEGEEAPSALDKLSVLKHHESFLCQVVSPILDSEPFWVKQPLENMFSSTIKTSKARKRKQVLNTSFTSKIIMSYGESEAWVLQSLRVCLGKLLDLEGSSWLFTQNGGYDEKLIDWVAAAEGYLRKEGTSLLNQVKCSEEEDMNDVISSVSNCGEHCTWQSGLVIGFGVWCICRILGLLLMESRPELWGKYTYVLNRLQGILDPAFLNPRDPLKPCQCIDHLDMRTSGLEHIKESLGGTRCTTASSVLQMIKEVEGAISRRKGRSGTAAGGIAFPKGKENLASVLKRYKRCLSKKSSATNGGASAPSEKDTEQAENLKLNGPLTGNRDYAWKNG